MAFGKHVTDLHGACRGTASAAGLLLRSWNAGGDGNAAILVDWERGMLEAVFEGGGGFDLATQTDLDPEAEAQRRVGGPVNLKPGEPLTVSSTAMPALQASSCYCMSAHADASSCERHTSTWSLSHRLLLGHISDKIASSCQSMHRMQMLPAL